MSERRIPMFGAAVRATLDGRATETRQLITPANSLFDGGPVSKKRWAEFDWWGDYGHGPWVDQGPSPAGNPGPHLKVPRPIEHELVNGFRRSRVVDTVHRIYPRIQPDDLLWVRESYVALPAPQGEDNGRAAYRATASEADRALYHWLPSFFMPKHLVRLWLRVTEVVPQRLQEIDAVGALEVGCKPQPDDCSLCMAGICSKHQPPIGCFAHRWDAHYVRRQWAGRRATWNHNPWVWVIGFNLMNGK